MSPHVDGIVQRDQHVLFVVNNYPPHLGGVEQHVQQLATCLVADGQKATVVTLAAQASDTLENGVRVIRLRSHFPIASVISFPGLGSGRSLAKRLTSEGITVVSTHTRFFPMSFVGIRLARKLKLPSIHTEHGAGPVKSPSPLIASAARVVDLVMGRHILRRASAVLSVSDEVAHFVADLSGRASTVFLNAINAEDWLRPGQREGQSGGPAKLSYLGRLVPGKGWDTFLDLAAAVASRPEYQDVRIEVLGDGPDMAEVLARVKRYGLEAQTTVHGHANAAVIREALTGSVLVNATELAEGFQITLIEAAAVGCQIVSYPAPGITPLLADGAPVRVVPDRSPAKLLAAVFEALKDPLPAMDGNLLSRWGWPIRAAEYRGIVEDVVAADNKEPDQPVRRR